MAYNDFSWKVPKSVWGVVDIICASGHSVDWGGLSSHRTLDVREHQLFKEQTVHSSSHLVIRSLSWPATKHSRSPKIFECNDILAQGRFLEFSNEKFEQNNLEPISLELGIRLRCTWSSIGFYRLPVQLWWPNTSKCVLSRWRHSVFPKWIGI